MQRYGLQLQLNKKQINLLFYLSLAVFAMSAFLFLGQSGYFLMDDSASYMDILGGAEGVMPIYPLFLYINQNIFGEESYLYAVIIEQSIFAALAVILFLRMIKNKFQLGYAASYVCFFLALLPFTLEMPEVMITHEILTEGIAYAAFYFFSIALLQAVWNKSWKWYALLCVVTLLLSAVRSQLQILFGVCGAVFIYIIVCGRKSKKKGQIPLRLLIGVIGCLATGLIGIRATSQIAKGYRDVIWQIDIRRTEEARKAEEQEQNQDTPENAAEEQALPPEYVSNQYVSLIFNKGMYEADYEDYQLFEDERLQDLYLELYEKIDEKRCRYVYARPGLRMWRDIWDCAMIGAICMDTSDEYLAEISIDAAFIDTSREYWTEIGLTLIKAHWGRFLYHTLMLMPQAFVSTVFFQIERIYLLCHLIALFLYVSAAALMIWAYADKKIERAYAEFMNSVLVTNCILAVVISVVFVGQKRYLFYNFGIFYIAYFLLLLQLWKQYGRDLVGKRIAKLRKNEADKAENTERQQHEE